MLQTHQKTLIVAVVVVFLSFVFAKADALTLENTLISTTDHIIIPGVFTSDGGHICGDTASIGAGKIVKISKDLGSWIFTASNVTCNDYTTFGNLHSSNVSFNGTCKALETTFDVLDCPEFPQFPQFTTSSVNVICNKSGVDLMPGNYGELRIESDGTCNFTKSGTYNFLRIIAATGRWNVNFVQDVNYKPYVINVVEFVNLGEYGKWNLEGTLPVYVNIEGDGDAFYHHGDGEYKVCRTYAPNGTVKFRGNLAPVSQVLSKDFETVRGLGVHLSMPDVEKCFGKKPDCSCLNNVPEIGSGVVTLSGKGFNVDTVNKIIFTTGAIDPINPIGVCEVVPVIVDEYTLNVDVSACPPGTYVVSAVNDTAMCTYRNMIEIQ